MSASGRNISEKVVAADFGASGTVLPDVDKIPDIVRILGTSCDYLMKDDALEEDCAPSREPGRSLQNLVGKKVQLHMEAPKGNQEKFIRIPSIASLHLAEEGAESSQ